ncbi:MAG: SH3 domain-containing protein [Halarcobacter sp.]
MYKFKHFIYLILFILLFTGCSYKNIKIADLDKYPQNPELYTKNITQTLDDQSQLTKEYLDKYFWPWSLKKANITKKDAQWGNIYKNKKVYLENNNLASKEWFEKVIDNSNFEVFNTASQKAIMVKNANVRVFPTISKLFYNPSVAGEGFPFDYNQNSSIKINTPIFISHYSKDKAWAYIQSHFVSGWVRVDNLALVSDEFINSFKTQEYGVAIKDNFPIFDSSFIEYIKIGTLFPNKNGKYLVAKKNIDAYATFSQINNDAISKFPLKFSKENISKLSSEFLGELYGWGGLLSHRDCSSFTQDFFSPFAVYLNRNSKAQSKGYKYLDISKLSSNEKKEFIIKNGVPFLTLIYLPGHIMIYIGAKDNEPLAMHNMWGVRTWKYPFVQGRNVVGKTVITTLEPGAELDMANPFASIIKKVKGIVILNEK